MSSASAALAVVQALPARPATLVCRLLALAYLASRPDYRAEIRANYRIVIGRDRPWFWVRNAWRVGRNIALMARIGTPFADGIVDSAEVCGDNLIRLTLEQELHSVMASFHFGAWEFLPQVFGGQELPVRLAVGVQRDPALQGRVEQLRQGRGVTLVRSLREVMESIDRPGITGFMLDNTSQGSQQWVVVDSVRLRMPELPFRLAERAGTKVIPMFARLDRGRLVVEAGIAGGREAAAASMLGQVRAHPEEWIWWGKSGAVKAANCE